MATKDPSQSLQQLQGMPLDALEQQIASGQLSDDLRAVLGEELTTEIEQMAQVGTPFTLSDLDRPLVVVLPGIIGSSLMNTVGDVGTIWLNPLALLAGKLSYLRMNSSGESDASPLVQIVASGLIPTHYLAFQFYLKTFGGCDVLGFPFDWRRSLDQAVEALRRMVVGHFQLSGRKFHLVGHSMGGLVARNFCLRYPAEAEQAVAQVIQLGTPNYGSCEPIRNLTVGNETTWLAEKLNTTNAPLDVLRTCPGLYAMLPAPQEFYPVDAPFPYPYTGDVPPYDVAAYRNEGVSAAHLRASRDGYEWLASAEACPVPLTIIAGYDLPTCLGVSRSDTTPGFDFDSGTTPDGDGTVPLASAVAVGATLRLYGRGLKHGSLPNYRSVRQAVRALIQGEQPTSLELVPFSSTLGAEEFGEPEQPMPGALSEAELDAIAERIRTGQATPEDLQVLAGIW